MHSTTRRRWPALSLRDRRGAVPAGTVALVYARATGGAITDPHTDVQSVLDAIATHEAVQNAALVEDLFNTGHTSAAEAVARHLGMLESSDRTLAALDAQGTTL